MSKFQNCKGFKHQNVSSYDCNKYNKIIDQKATLSIAKENICQKCLKKIEWKIKFGKYKPLTTLRSCNKCHLKQINRAYNKVCDVCSKNEKICANCENFI
ncbi:hypothetical protein MXB_2989, partial [Myxobolus squamalis]